ncbi:MAG: universal stress protein [Pseudomonadota bacterium]
MGTNNKILVAVDASAQSLATVAYVSQIFAPETTQVVLFHVDTQVPDAYWDMDLGPGFNERIASVKSWAYESGKVMDQQLENCNLVLLNAGFPKTSVTIEKQVKQRGIARDLLDKVKQGFHAVAVGRTGVSRIKDLAMGNIASKLVGKLEDTTLIVVGQEVLSPRRILLAFDGSANAMTGVDTVCAMVPPAGVILKICYVIRQALGYYPGVSLDMETLGHDLMAMKKEMIAPHMDEAVKRLEAAGFFPDSIIREIQTGKPSRSQALIDDAEAHDFGTIVVGRRGISAVEEFFMGRVSKKVLQMADSTTVWIVSSTPRH